MADDRTSVAWGVVWKLGRERRLRLIVTEVPGDVARRLVLEALEAAGYRAVFAEGGVPWVNHQLLAEARWPAGATTTADTGRMTWEQLSGRQEARTLSIRVTPQEYSSLVLASRAAGEQLYPWCRRQLVEAAVIRDS